MKIMSLLKEQLKLVLVDKAEDFERKITYVHRYNRQKYTNYAKSEQVTRARDRSSKEHAL